MSSREQDDAGPTLLGISITILILVLTTTALRIAVRAKRSNLGADDYTIAAASLLTIGRVTCQFISVGYGNGRHREFLSVHAYQRINFLTWLTQLFLFPILCLLKISVCLLVLRVKSTKALRYGLWSLMVLLVLSTLLPEIVLLAECDPVSAYWMSHADRCWDPNVRIYSIYLQTGRVFLQPRHSKHPCYLATPPLQTPLLTSNPSRLRLRRRRLHSPPHCRRVAFNAVAQEQNRRLRAHELGSRVSLSNIPDHCPTQLPKY